jgi:hypothetical protein
MRYPPIYHLRCAICHASSLAVGGFDPRYACPTCARLDLDLQVDWPRPAGWMVTHVFARDRTPWVDALGYPERLFQVYTPGGFLERLCHSLARAREDPSVGTFFAAPGLCRTRTLHHTAQCQWDGGLCVGECPESVTYAPVAITAN